MQNRAMLLVLCVMGALIVFPVMAQDERGRGPREGRAEERGGRPERRGPGRGDMQGGGKMKGGGQTDAMLVARIVSNPTIAKKFGLSEEQITTLSEAMQQMRKEQIPLNAQMELAALEQAKLMTAKPIDEEAVMAAVEATGKIRTEIAKLQVKQLLLVNRTLTQEQIETIKERIREKMRGRGGNMRGRGRGEGDNEEWDEKRQRQRREWEAKRREHKAAQEEDGGEDEAE